MGGSVHKEVCVCGSMCKQVCMEAFKYGGGLCVSGSVWGLYA